MIIIKGHNLRRTHIVPSIKLVDSTKHERVETVDVHQNSVLRIFLGMYGVLILLAEYKNVTALHFVIKNMCLLHSMSIYYCVVSMTIF